MREQRRMVWRGFLDLPQEERQDMSLQFLPLLHDRLGFAYSKDQIKDDLSSENFGPGLKNEIVRILLGRGCKRDCVNGHSEGTPRPHLPRSAHGH
jgi:hypothetical protein